MNTGGGEEMNESLIEAKDDRTAGGDWIDCPHCNQKVLVHFRSKVWIQHAEGPGDTAVPRGEFKKKEWRDGLSGQQMNILDHATRSGLLDSFVAALERGPHHGVPKNKEKYFLEWLVMSKRKVVPEWALAEFRELCPGKFIEFFGSNFVGAVVAGGEIMLFMPIDLIAGIKLKTTMGGEKRMAAPDASGIRQWVRTKMGYVPQDARIALEETRKRSIGEFANPVL